jgi:N-acetylmuramoyl-L-alanine amidase
VYLHADDSEDLRRRAEVANSSGADLLLSIPTTRAAGRRRFRPRSGTYGEVDHSPASLDVARYVSTALMTN